MLSDLGFAGAEISTLHIIKYINRSIFSPVVICINIGGELENDLNNLNVPYYMLNKGSLLDIGGYIKMYRLLKILKIDILHTILFEAHIYGQIVGYFASVPIVSTFQNMSRWHTSATFRNRLKTLLGRITTNYFSDLSIAVSKSVRNYYISLGYNKRPFKVVYNSIPMINVNHQNNSKNMLRESFEIEPKTKILIAIGRLDRQKGYEYLFPAIKIVNQAQIKVKLFIYGYDQSNGYYQKLVAEHGLQDDVYFQGVVKDIHNIYTQADLFVSSSLWEGLPMVHVEACLYKCPVVSTNIGGSNEVIHHNVNGWLVPPENSEALSSGIIRLLTDPDLNKRFVKTGYRMISNKFDIKKNIKILEDIYLNMGGVV